MIMKYICDIVARYAYISRQPENRSRTCENKTIIYFTIASQDIVFSAAECQFDPY